MLALIQAVESAPPWATLGVGGGLASLVLYLWRQDRTASDTRYEVLAKDFREIVQENTKAITSLTDALTHNLTVREALDQIRSKTGSTSGS